MKSLLTAIKKGLLSLLALFIGGQDTIRAIELPEMDESLKNQDIIPEPCPNKEANSEREAVSPLVLPYTEMPQETVGYIRALSTLAEDIFRDPDAAKDFARGPSVYLKRLGLRGDGLDSGTTEVKVILALGNDKVRAAIQNNDPEGFIKSLEELGLLDYKRVKISGILAKSRAEILKDPHTRRALKEMGIKEPERQPSREEIVPLVYPVVALAYLVAAAAAYVVVTLLYYTSISPGPAGDSTDDDNKSGPAMPALLLANFMGGKDFSEKTFQRYIDNHVDTMISTIHRLAMKAKAPPADEILMRDFLKKQLLKQFGR